MLTQWPWVQNNGMLSNTAVEMYHLGRSIFQADCQGYAFVQPIGVVRRFEWAKRKTKQGKVGRGPASQPALCEHRRCPLRVLMSTSCKIALQQIDDLSV